MGYVKRVTKRLFLSESRTLVNEKTGSTSPSYYSTAKNIDSVRDGISNPNWKRQIKYGQNATTPMTASEYQVHLKVPLRGRAEYPGWYTHHITSDYGISLPSLSGFGSLQSAADNIARTIVYQRDLSSNSKLLTSLGELRESIRMIRNPALALRRGLGDYYSKMTKTRRQIARSGRGRHKRFRDVVSNSWLEYSFGWAPLVGDIQSGLDTYRDRADRPEYEPFRGGNLQEERKPRTFITSSGTVGFSWKSYAEDVNQALVFYRGAVFSKMQTSFGLANFGLWPSEFVPTAWELVPWSFAIDYFTNIGAVLNSWATAQRVDFAWVCKTIVLSQRRKTSIEVFPSPGWHWSGNRGASDITYKTVSRGSQAGLPIPSLSVGTHFTLGKGLNVAALTQLKIADFRFKP